MDHHREILEYFKSKGVSVIFLFRRNLLRRFISVLANNYDRHAKQLNGTHKSHVHSKEEVSDACLPFILKLHFCSIIFTVDLTADSFGWLYDNNSSELE